jgi:multidrug efflux pump subunit AcrB
MDRFGADRASLLDSPVMSASLRRLAAALALALPLHACSGLLAGTARHRGAPPTIVVEAALPGADPTEIEQRLALPLETELLGLPALQHVDATCHEGLVQMELRFEPSADPLQSAEHARARLAAVTHLADGSPPSLRVQQPSTRATVVLSGAEMPTLGLQATELRRALLQLPGVRDAQMRGQPELSIEVRVDGPALMARDLTLGDVAAALQPTDSAADGARIMRSGGGSLPTVDVPTVDDLAHLLLDGEGLRLGDIATLSQQPTWPDGRVRLDGAPAVSLVLDLPDKPRDVLGAVADTLRAYPQARLLPAEGLQRVAVRAPTTDDLDAALRAMTRGRSPSYTVQGADPGTAGEVWLWDRDVAQALSADQPGLQLRWRQDASWRVVLSGPDRGPLESLAEPVLTELAAVPGVTFAGLRFPPGGAPEVEIALSPGAASAVGLQAAGLARALRDLHGRELHMGRDRTVQLRVEGLGSLDDPGSVQIPVRVDGALVRVPLAAVATIRLVQARGSLSRRDGQPALIVDVDLGGEGARRAIETQLAQVPLPPGVTLIVEASVDPN